MNRLKQFARKWGSVPSAVVSAILIVLAAYFWIEAHQLPDGPASMVDHNQMRGTVFLFVSVFLGLAALVNGVLLGWTRLPWKRLAQVGSVVNIVLGVLTIPAIIGVVLIYNGVVGWLRFAESSHAHKL